MIKANINPTNFCFSNKYTSCHFVVFMNKKTKKFLFANDRYALTVLTKKLIGNMI